MKAQARPLAPAGESGQATVLGIGLVFVVLVAIGLVWDGTRILVARARVQTVVDSAALAGATGIDPAWIVAAGPGTPPVLDAATAAKAARRSLELSEVQQAPMRVVTDSVDVRRDAVSVSAHTGVPMSFLSLVGLGTVEVGASAEATPRQLSR